MGSNDKLHYISAYLYSLTRFPALKTSPRALYVVGPFSLSLPLCRATALEVVAVFGPALACMTAPCVVGASLSPPGIPIMIGVALC